MKTIGDCLLRRSVNVVPSIATSQTMPLAVYLLLETNPEASFILSLVLLSLSLLVLIGLRDRWLGSA